MKSFIPTLKTQWPLLLFGFSAVFFGNVGQTFFVGIFSTHIQESLGLSASAYGSAYSLATLASAITVIWAGSLIDHMPLRRYTIGVCLGLTIATFSLSQASNLVFLIFSFFLLRLFGQALLPHTGSTTIAKHFDSHRGKALSISSSGFPVGEVILPASATAAIAYMGWQNTYLLIAGVVLLFVLPLMLFLLHKSGLEEIASSADSKKQNQHKANAVRKALLTDYRYWLALPGLMAGPFIVTGIFIHQDYIITLRDWTPAWFAFCFVVYGVVHWLSIIIAGLLVDRFSAVKLLPFYMLPMALGLMVVALFSGPWVGVVFMALMAASIGASPPISGSLWPEIYGVNNLGTVRSINSAILVFSTALSPALYGLAIDRSIELFWVMGSSAVLTVVASVLYLFSYFGNSYKHPISASQNQQTI